VVAEQVALDQMQLQKMAEQVEAVLLHLLLDHQ
jgi:hypothetical protein